MALTLNQVVARIKSLAIAHNQINYFYFGDQPEFDANGDINYPACFLEQTAGSIDRIERLQTFNFRMYLADRVMVAENTEGNETEVLSDMHSVAADMLAMLMSYDYEGDWLIVDNSAVTPFTESLGDMVAGCFVDIGVKVDFLADRCQVPVEAVTFQEDFDMARTKLITYTGTGSEGDSFTVSDIAGKIVVAAFRTTYRRPVTTLPTTSDDIRVVGTNLGSGKGILTPTGVVGLQTGDALVNGERLDFLVWD